MDENTYRLKAMKHIIIGAATMVAMGCATTLFTSLAGDKANVAQAQAEAEAERFKAEQEKAKAEVAMWQKITAKAP